MQLIHSKSFINGGEGNAVRTGIRRVYPDALVEVRPLADGGEGTVDALAAGMNGVIHEISVTGPLGEPVTARYGIIESTHTAIMEMSQAAGITLVPAEEEIRCSPLPME